MAHTFLSQLIWNKIKASKLFTNCFPLCTSRVNHSEWLSALALNRDSVSEFLILNVYTERHIAEDTEMIRQSKNISHSRPSPSGLWALGKSTCLKLMPLWSRPKNLLQLLRQPLSNGFTKRTPVPFSLDRSFLFRNDSMQVSPLVIMRACQSISPPIATNAETVSRSSNMMQLFFTFW